jgi:hypothetical protein
VSPAAPLVASGVGPEGRGRGNGVSPAVHPPVMRPIAATTSASFAAPGKFPIEKPQAHVEQRSPSRGVGENVERGPKAIPSPPGNLTLLRKSGCHLSLRENAGHASSNYSGLRRLSIWTKRSLTTIGEVFFRGRGIKRRRSISTGLLSYGGCSCSIVHGKQDISVPIANHDVRRSRRLNRYRRAYRGERSGVRRTIALAGLIYGLGSIDYGVR